MITPMSNSSEHLAVGRLPAMFFSSVSYPVDAAEFMTAGEMRNERYTMIQISGHLGGLL